MTERARILIVDDDQAVGSVLASLLVQAGHDAVHVLSGLAALEALAARGANAIISDLRMPGMDGLELLDKLKRRAPDVPVVMLSAHATVPLAVEAMKAGAAGFLLKPFDRDEVLYTLRLALEASARLRSQPPAAENEGDGGLLGESSELEECRERIRRAAPTATTVLLRGESGTGKEVAAKMIHRLSARSAGPFVVVNCAALPDTLLESELFGYEKGAFTGAVQRKPGRVHVAAGGTLFLDEIGDIALPTQAKILRLLQEKELQRLGGTQPKKVDVRFVAATHRDLDAMVRDGKFREDLYYRLSVVPVWMPPLRTRAGDVILLARKFVDRFAREAGRPGLVLDESAIAALADRAWPGNVRELQNLMERLVVFTDGSAITGAAVERELGRHRTAKAPESTSASLSVRRGEAEHEAILDALARAKGNRTQAARLLGVSRRTLYNKLAELGS